ncbi:MAG TPA: hypothetical protein VFC31_12495 [Candidatus Limnocylindria bacterium]|nr:hypothetical protein [Candidatus Limnocylindria bacterium]
MRASPAATAAPTATPRISPSPSPARAPGENPILGYRITLPGTYRLSRSTIVPGSGGLLGSDAYTFATEAEERAECLEDRGDIPSPSDAASLLVTAYRNVGGVPPVERARSRPWNIHRAAEPAMIDGNPAAKLVRPGETEATPVPSRPPREAAAETARSLAAKDADAVARLITPGCWLGFGATVGGVNTGGAVNRAVASFIPALRERFASNDLAVNVDPTLQVDARGGGFFVRSEWIESDRTTPLDLWLNETDGAWRWTGAMHDYDRLGPGGCIPYRSPWITPAPGSCSP